MENDQRGGAGREGVHKYRNPAVCIEASVPAIPLHGGFGFPPDRYVISSLELLVAEDYMIVYLNGATPRRRMPGLGWLKKCYQMIDRR